MKWGPFKEGMLILDRYANEHDDVCAEHDQFWAGPASPEMVSRDDAKRLEELGWFIDQESWSCCT